MRINKKSIMEMLPFIAGAILGVLIGFISKVKSFP